MDGPTLVPEFYVSDLSESVAFYVDLLGFEVLYARPAEHFVALERGGARLMLEQAPSLARASRDEFARGQWRSADLERPFGRGVNLEIDVDDAAAIARRLSERGYPLLLPLHDRFYRVGEHDLQVRQLLVADPDGYLIRPSQRVDRAADESSPLESRVRAEIEALHDFFVGWFSGALPEAAFDEHFLSRFDSQFLLVPPAGLRLGVEDLASSVRRGYATNPAFRVAIRNVEVLREFDGQVLATYEEWQRHALASKPAENARLATVLFRKGDPLRWLHIHETWLPDEVASAGPYDF